MVIYAIFFLGDKMSSEFIYDDDKAKEIGKGLEEILNEADAIKSGYNDNINSMSDISSSAVSKGATLVSNLADIHSSINNIIKSYNDSLAAVKKFQEESSSLIDGMQSSESTQSKLFDSINELNGVISFNFTYPEASGSMKKVKAEDLIAAFEKSNAKKAGSNTYQVTIDGVDYRYDITNERLYTRGSDGRFYPNHGEYGIKCIFYTSDNNLDFSKIKNTITFLGGSGCHRYGPDKIINNPGNVKLNSNSLFTVLYGGNIVSDALDNQYNNMVHKTNLIAGSTRLSNYLAGAGTTKKIHNSLVGASEGAMAGFKAVNQNPGLYQTLVASNGASGVTNMSSSAFKDVEIILLESENNKDWNPRIVTTLKNLVKSGVPSKNISLYSNDSGLINQSQTVIGTDRVFTSTDEYFKSHGKWSAHGDGYSMIAKTNVFSYLSNKS